MDLALLVYAISLLANLKIFLLLSIIACVSIAFVWVMSYVDSDRREQHRWAMAKRFAAIAVAIELLNILVPSERTAYTMVGAYATQKVAEDPRVQETGEKVLKIINKRLDEILAEDAHK